MRRQLSLEVPVLNMRVFKIKGFTMGVLGALLSFFGGAILSLVLSQRRRREDADPSSERLLFYA